MKRSLLCVGSVLISTAAHAQDGATQPTTTTTTPTQPVATTQPIVQQPSSSSAQMENGFVLETHFYAEVVSFLAAGTPLNLPLLVGGFFVGYKLDRVMFGLGYNLSSYDNGGAQIMMSWVPGVRVDIIRSSDERVDLFGQFDFGIGHDFGSAQSNESFSPDLGVGVRYWVHRQFAFSAVTGWNGLWQVGQNPSTSVVLQGIFGGLQVLGVF